MLVSKKMGCPILAYCLQKQTHLRCVWNSREQSKTHVRCYDYGKRFYDPQLGRFHTIDPIIEKLPHQTPYNYASNNPVTLIDFWGLQGIDPNKVKVVFKPGVSDAKVTNYSIQVLQRVGGATGNTVVRVGSTYRSPQAQINVMYKQTIEKGAEAQFKLYSSKGDKVIQAQLDASKVKGATETSIKNAMTKTAEEVGFTSAHSSSNYENRNAIDVTRSDFTKEQIATIKTELPNIDPNVKLIDEPDRNCLHFEIPNQEATYSGGGIDAVEVSGQGSSYLTPLPATVTTTSNSEEELILQ